MAAAAIFFIAAPASDLHAKPFKSHVKVDLLSEVKAVTPKQPFWVAIRLQMDKDWHTYWKNPGDSGGPTLVDWRLPPGFKASPLQWPYPQKIEAPPLVSFGYEGEALLLAQITPPASLGDKKAVTLEAAVDWLECTADTCKPGRDVIKLDLPVRKGPVKSDPAILKKFSEARFRIPLPDSGWNIKVFHNRKTYRLQLTPPEWFKGQLHQIEFFPEEVGIINYAEPQSLSVIDNVYTLDVYRSDITTTTVQILKGILISDQGWRGPKSEKAIEVAVPVGPFAKGAKSDLTAAWALLFALLGGVLLNLMPCVLPVLSIKVLSFVQQAGGHPKQTRTHGWCYTAGVLFSFWILVGLLLLLRRGGEQLGWGFQLQSPGFIAVLSALFFFLGLNLLGVFEIGTSLTRAGSLSSKTKGYVHSFFTGVLATVVATPCTAPFMGSALGFALSQPVWLAFLIFTALGAGMAAPYLVLSYKPSLLRFVPKPGAWMETFKQSLGFLFLGTVIWLVWVFGQQRSIHEVAVLLSSLLVVGMAAWILGRWGTNLTSTATRVISYGVAIALIGGAVGGAIRVTLLTDEAKEQGMETLEKIPWEPYSAKRVRELRSQGKPLFIDFTAAWCLTCQVNDRVTFGSKDVVEKFKNMDIVPMKADWTSRDLEITKALESYGRSGVPAYVLYGRTPNSAPVLLPEILTPQIVIKALEQLK